MFRLMDLHVDVGTSLLSEKVFGGKGFLDAGPDAQFDLSKALSGRYSWVVSAVFPGTRFVDPGSGKVRVTFGCSRCITLEQVKAIVSVEKAFAGKVKVARRFEDLKAGMEGTLTLIIGLEGAYPLSEPADLIELSELGVKVLGLTWNVENGFAASCMSRKDYGLTGSGEELVKLANKLGVVVDLAHASEKTMLDVLSVSRKPVLISHTAAKALNDHPRNVSDEVLEELKRNGGVVGATLVPSFLRQDGKATLEDFVRHVMHFVEVAGPDHVGVGTDFLGIPSTPEGLENASKVQAVLEALLKEGLSESEVEGIAWRNAYRVLEASLPQ
ncbi:MAG: dipeptidase [Desulfurococcales archaeon]|nr:dipeptidase [Desulfurococcales archaeon]